MMRFESTDRVFGLFIPDELLETIKPHLKAAGCDETGGILIGHYDSALRNAILHSFSPPPKDSSAGCFWFRRGNNGLSALLRQQWKKGRYYLGEWHFHPKAAPDPSGQDHEQMKKIANDFSYKCPEPIMIIVGGTAESFRIRAFVFAEKPIRCFELHHIQPGPALENDAREIASK